MCSGVTSCRRVRLLLDDSSLTHVCTSLWFDGLQSPSSGLSGTSAGASGGAGSGEKSKGSAVSAFGWGGGDGPLNQATAGLMRDMIMGVDNTGRCVHVLGTGST